MRNWLETLATKRDELHQHVVLAGMDLEQEWSPIEKKLRYLVALEAERDEILLQLHLARMEARHEISALADQLERIAQQTERDGHDASLEMKEAVTGVTGRVRDLAKGTRPS